jgi:hypothetical protein
MGKNVKSIIIYIVAVILVIIIFVGFNTYRENLLSKTIKDNLEEYFKTSNSHISSHDFSISNINIICRGKNAYIVEFNLHLNDNASPELDKLGTILYKSNNIWHVKGFSSGITTDELKSYNLRCYN